jgi:hypothetical protein
MNPSNSLRNVINKEDEASPKASIEVMIDED